MFKRITSLLLAFAMVISGIPMQALADNMQTAEDYTVEEVVQGNILPTEDMLSAGENACSEDEFETSDDDTQMVVETDIILSIQDPEPNSRLTIEQAIALGVEKDHDVYTESKYYVGGMISEICNAQVGSMIIADESGNILYIDGTFSADGSVSYESMDVKPGVGDTVIIYGVIGQYNGEPQIKNGWIIEYVSAESEEVVPITEPIEPTDNAESSEIAEPIESTEFSEVTEPTIEEAEAKESKENKVGICGENANWTFDEATGTLTISGTGAMYDMAWTDDEIQQWGEANTPWNDLSDEIVFVVVKEGITRIGDNAFANCSNLKTIQLSDSLATIGARAFGNTALESVTLPNSVVFAGWAAFAHCDVLEHFVFSEAMPAIGEYMFWGCNNLKTVEIPNTIATIEEAAFVSSGLENIVIPDSVTTIRSGAFAHCEELESVEIPNSVTVIERTTFAGCSSLESITLPKTITSIGELAFASNYSLKTISIPETVLEIGMEAFRKCNALESITFEGDAPSFGENVFNEITTVVYYPANNLTWTEEVRQNYGGTITWIAVNDEDDAEVSNIITVNAPMRTESTSITVNGTAPANAEISIYLNNSKVSNTTADASGDYSAWISLGTLTQSTSFMLKAECVGSNGVVCSATQGVYFQYVTSLVQEIRFYGDSESKEYIVLNSSGEQNIIDYTGTENPYKFEVQCQDPEKIGNLYITSTVNNVKKCIDATYNEETGTFVAVGYFDSNNKFYDPGTISIEYTLKAKSPEVGESVDWNQMNRYLSDDITSAQVNNTNDDSGSHGNVDFSGTISSLENVVMDYSIKTFDSQNGTELGTIRSYYKTGENIFSYIVPGLDDSRYYAYLDFSDPNTYKMLIDDGLDVASKAVELELDFTDSYSAQSIKLSNMADTLSKAGTIVSVAGDLYNIHQDTKKLREEIASSDHIKDKQAAYAAANELETDKIAFALLVTALPILVSGGAAMPAAATLFSGIIGVMSAASDAVYQHRVAGVTGGSVETDWHDNIKVEEGQIGDNLFVTTINVYRWIPIWDGASQQKIIDHIEKIIHGTGPMWKDASIFYNPLYDWETNTSWKRHITKVEIQPGLTSIADYFFSDCINLETISLPGSVRTIGDGAFARCSKLESINLPTYLEYIGTGAFAHTAITELTMPKGIKEGDDSVFACGVCDHESWSYGIMACSQINIVRFEDGCERIPDNMLSQADSIETVYLPTSVKEIGNKAFRDCDGLTEIVLPDNVEVIGDDAFLGCTYLESIHLSEALRTIGKNAFSGTDIKQLYLPANVQNICLDTNSWDWGKHSFYGMKLESIDVDERNPYFTSKDGVLFDKQMKTLLKYPGARTDDYRIPDGVTAIGSYAFTDAKLVDHTLTFPKSVRYFASRAFFDYNYSAKYEEEYEYNAILKFEGPYHPFTLDGREGSTMWNNQLEGSDVEILYPAANNTRNNWSVVVGSNFYAENVVWTEYEVDITIPDLEGQPFDDGFAWTFDDLTKTLTISGMGMMPNFTYDSTTLPWLEHLNQIETVIINEGITYLGEYTFYNYPKLKLMYLPASLSAWGYCAVHPNFNMKEIHVAEGSETYVSENGILYSKDMTTLVLVPGGMDGSKIQIPDTVTTLADWSMAYTSNITELVIPEGVTTIGENALFNSVRMSKLSLPSTLESIGPYALSACIALTEITVHPSNPSYSAENNVLFTKDMSKLFFFPMKKSGMYTVPDSVRVLDGSAFYYCQNLSGVILPENLEKIGEQAFLGCEALTSITIPQKVSEIGFYAFGYCSDLSAITFQGDAPVFGGNIFAGITATVSYPANNPTWTEEVRQNYGGNITWVPYEVEEEGYRINLDADVEAVWIDGVEYATSRDHNGTYVRIEHSDATSLVTYTWHDAQTEDPHSNYPVSMKVWLLNFENDAYTATYVPEFDNLLQYSGMSIRVTGKKGVRMITGIDKVTREALMNDSLAGYTLAEYGTVVAWTSALGENSLTLDQSGALSNFAYKRDVADPIFRDIGEQIQFTNVLVGFNEAQCVPDLVMRSYIILEDATGNQITIYGGEVVRSIGYIAWQNRDSFTEGTEAYNYVWQIIRLAYGEDVKTEN